MLEACVIWMSPLLKKIKKAAPKMLWGAVRFCVWSKIFENRSLICLVRTAQPVERIGCNALCSEMQARITSLYAFSARKTIRLILLHHRIFPNRSLP